MISRIDFATQDSHPEVRRLSLAALGNIGPAAVDAVSIIADALKDPDRDQQPFLIALDGP
jgi:hypothetical protein